MDSNTSQIGSIAIFCKAAELASFTAAAKIMAITPAAVSRVVGRLEDRLGVRLFQRTTRRMSLTDEGRVYFEQCSVALAQIDDAEKSISGRQAAPRGLLRVSAPTTYAHYRLLPRLAEFRRQFPDIQLDINVSNRNIDFVDEGYDVAIRLGQPPDSRLVARKIEDAPVGLFASPQYLKERGVPRSIEALRDASVHTLLPFVLPSTGKVLPWIARAGGENIEFSPRSALTVSEDPLACVRLARAGAGIVQTFTWIAAAYREELTEVLKRNGGRTRPFFILYPQNRHLSVKVRTLVAFLASTS
jgi:DNA-binding transcriptional LysR family regulator